MYFLKFLEGNDDTGSKTTHSWLTWVWTKPCEHVTMCFTSQKKKKFRTFTQDLLIICLHIKEEYLQEKWRFFWKRKCLLLPKNMAIIFLISEFVICLSISHHYHLSISVYYTISVWGFISFSLLITEWGL